MKMRDSHNNRVCTNIFTQCSSANSEYICIYKECVILRAMDLARNEKISDIVEIVLSGLIWFVITAFLVKIYQSLEEERSNNIETDETKKNTDCYAIGKEMDFRYDESIELSK